MATEQVAAMSPPDLIHHHHHLSMFRENLLYLEEHKYTNIILSIIMVSLVLSKNQKC